VHVKGTNNVADYLSRIPGTESLSGVQLCSYLFTCGVHHECDLPCVGGRSHIDCHSVISVFDHGTIVSAVKESQRKFLASDKWF